MTNFLLVLSYVEKEKLITSLRKQDPHTELLLSSLREENGISNRFSSSLTLSAPKEHAKLILYAFLYPKQANKVTLSPSSLLNAVEIP